MTKDGKYTQRFKVKKVEVRFLHARRPARCHHSLKLGCGFCSICAVIGSVH